MRAVVILLGGQNTAKGVGVDLLVVYNNCATRLEKQTDI
jgi:hypothetical protein